MPRLGVLSNFYVNIQTVSNPIWQALPLISDCNVNGTWDQGDASTRQSRSKMFEPTLMDTEITGKVRVTNSEQYQSYLNLYNAWYSDLVVEVLVLNGALNENNADGFRFQAKVFNWSEDQSLGAVLFKDFSVKPCIPDLIVNVPRVVRVVLGVMLTAPIGAGYAIGGGAP